MATIRKVTVFDPALLKVAVIDSFIKLNPKMLCHSPVMFVVEIVTVLTTILLFLSIGGVIDEKPFFIGQISLWLWFTVLFANFSEAMAEGRGKAQANSLRQTKVETKAKLLTNEKGTDYKLIPATDLKK